MSDSFKIVDEKVLSSGWASLNAITYTAQTSKGETFTATREVYNRGNGATILLYNTEKQTVILTRQLRIPTYFNGNASAKLIETPAGKLDEKDPDPEEGIRRETQEETGYTLGKVTRIMEAYMSPGAVTESIFFFAAPYTSEMKTSEGGGLEEENEDIEVMEMSFAKAWAMVKSGEIKDAKTIMLLQWGKIEGILE